MALAHLDLVTTMTVYGKATIEFDHATADAQEDNGIGVQDTVQGAVAKVGGMREERVSQRSGPKTANLRVGVFENHYGTSRLPKFQHCRFFGSPIRDG